MPLGCAVGELRGDERASGAPPPLAARHDQAVAVEGMGDVLPAVAQGHGGGGCEGEGGQDLCRRRGERADEGGGGGRGYGQDQRARGHHGAVGDGHGEAAPRPGQGAHGRPLISSVYRKALHERLHQLAQPAPEGVEGRTATRARCRSRAGGPHPADEAAVPGLQVHEAREGGADGESLGIAGVDAGHERLAQALDRLLPEAPAHEGGDRLVARRPAAGQDEVQGHAQLAPPGEKAAG